MTEWEREYRIAARALQMAVECGLMAAELYERRSIKKEKQMTDAPKFVLRYFTGWMSPEPTDTCDHSCLVGIKNVYMKCDKCGAAASLWEGPVMVPSDFRVITAVFENLEDDSER